MAKRFAKYGGFRVAVDAKSGLPTKETLNQLTAKLEEQTPSNSEGNSAQSQTQFGGDLTASKQIEELRNKIVKLEGEMEKMKQYAILVNGNVDSTTVQVLLKGRKRRITHSAP